MTLERWLQPVSDEQPCGLNLEYDPDFQRLEEAAKEKLAEEFGRDGGEILRIEGKAANWDEVCTLADGLLVRSKDLGVAVYLTRALLHTQGFSGIADGLALIKGLLDKFWEGLYPELENDGADATTRINSLAPLDSLDAVVGDLRRSVVVRSRRHGQLTVRDIEVAQGRLKPLADAPVLSEAQLNIVVAAALEEKPDLRRLAGEALGDLKSIAAIVGERAGDSSVPELKHLQTVLYNVDQAFAAVAPQLAAGDAAGGRPGEDGGWQQDSKAIAPAAAGEIRSRDDVVRTLARVCDYLVRHEPTNPVQFLLRRAQRMMGMSFLELMRDMAPDGLEQAETVVGEKLETEDKEEE